MRRGTNRGVQIEQRLRLPELDARPGGANADGHQPAHLGRVEQFEAVVAPDGHCPPGCRHRHPFTDRFRELLDVDLIRPGHVRDESDPSTIRGYLGTVAVRNERA